MIVGLLAAALAAPWVGQTHLSWTAGGTLEARGRSAVPGDKPYAEAAADGEMTPRLGATVTNGEWSAALSYTPVFRIREPYSSTTWRNEHTQAGQFNAQWRRPGLMRPYLSQSVLYGLTDLSTLFATPARSTLPGVTNTPVNRVSTQPVPTLGLVRQFDLDSTLGIDWPLAPTVLLTTELGYFWGGGSDRASRQNMPVQSSPRLIARLGWTASRIDTLTTSLAARYAKFSSQQAVTSIELSEIWQRSLSDSVRLDVSAGLAAAGGQNRPGRPIDGGLLPLAAVNLSGGFGVRSHHFEAYGGVLAAPFIDRFAGSVYERVEMNAGISWAWVVGVNAYARLGVARGLGPLSGNLFTTYSEGGAGYAGAPWWRVDLIGRFSSVSGPPTPAQPNSSPLLQWVVGLSATFQTQGDT